MIGIIILVTAVIWVQVIVKLTVKKASPQVEFYSDADGIGVRDSIQFKDSIVLVTDFINPFSSPETFRAQKKSRSDGVATKTFKNIKVTKEQKSMVWPPIKYSGRIVNHTTNMTSAIVVLNKKTMVVKPPEEKGGIHFLTAYPDSLVCEYLGELRTFRLDE